VELDPSMGTMGDSPGVSTATTAEDAAAGGVDMNGAVANGDGDGHTGVGNGGVFKSEVWWSGLRTSNTVWDAWLVAAAGQVF